MAFHKLCGLPFLVLLALAVAAPGSALKLEPDGARTHFPPLLDCSPPTAAPPRPPSAENDDAAFRASVRSLLAALPSAAAAAPGGFAATRSASGSGRARARAFARALCFGAGAPHGPSTGDCRACLAAAAADVLGSRCVGSRRAAAWRAGCFLAYADTNASAAREDAFGGWFYDDTDDYGDAPTAALGSQCAPDRGAAECSRCMNESAHVVPALKAGRRLSMVHGDAVVVVGYACYLRVSLVDPVPRWAQYVNEVLFGIEVIVVVLFEVLGVMFCISKAGQVNPAG